MSRKSRYVPLPDRVVNVAKLIDIHVKDKNDPYTIGLHNGIEMSLAVLEQRDPVLKETPRHNGVNQWIKLKLFKIIGLSKNKGLKEDDNE